jgi:hypothetical protein
LLAAADPAAYEIDLARSLCTSAEVRSILRTELHAAVSLLQESVSICQRWISQLPGLTDYLRSALILATDVLTCLDQGDVARIIRRLTNDGSLEEAASVLQNMANLQ